MKVVLPLPAMPTQTIETGVLGFATGAEPSGAFAEDIPGVVCVIGDMNSEWRSGWRGFVARWWGDIGGALAISCTQGQLKERW